MPCRIRLYPLQGRRLRRRAGHGLPALASRSASAGRGQAGAIDELPPCTNSRSDTSAAFDLCAHKIMDVKVATLVLSQLDGQCVSLLVIITPLSRGPSRLGMCYYQEVVLEIRVPRLVNVVLTNQGARS